MQRCGLLGQHLRWAQLQRRRYRSAKFNGCNLTQNADFTGANLTDAELADTAQRGLALTNAVLTGSLPKSIAQSRLSRS